MKPDNVVSLEERLHPRPLLSVAPAPVCRAHNFELCRKTRTARCQRCDTNMDPFDALVYIAERWGEYLRNREHLGSEIERLRGDHTRLEVLVRKLRAGVRRRVRALAEQAPADAIKALELLIRWRTGMVDQFDLSLRAGELADRALQQAGVSRRA